MNSTKYYTFVPYSRAFVADLQKQEIENQVVRNNCGEEKIFGKTFLTKTL